MLWMETSIWNISSSPFCKTISMIDQLFWYGQTQLLKILLFHIGLCGVKYQGYSIFYTVSKAFFCVLLIKKGCNFNYNQPLTVKDSLVLKKLGDGGVCVRDNEIWQLFVLHCSRPLSPCTPTGSLGAAILNHASAHCWLEQPCWETLFCFFLPKLAA